MGGRTKCPHMDTHTNHVDFSGENIVKYPVITPVKIHENAPMQTNLAIPITVVTLLSSTNRSEH